MIDLVSPVSKCPDPNVTLKRNRLSGLIPEWVKETKKWNEYASICISLQQKNYGYSNYSHKEEN